MKASARFLLLFSFLSLALLWQLGSHGLTEPDEGRTAGIGFEMYETGSLLIPRLYDLAQFNKPPLTYWACAFAYKIFGVNEWSARLPTFLAGLGTLLLTRAIARRLFGEREALAATLILLTSPMFFIMARIIDPNMMLTFWTTLAMWSAVAWIQDARTQHRWLFWLALGLAFLTKGPPALAIVLLPVIALRFIRPAAAETPRLACRKLFHLPALLAALTIGLSWYIAVAIQHPELWKFFLGQELLDRLTGAIPGRAQPFWYFIPMLVGGMLPWLPTLLIALRNATGKFRTDPATRLLLAWAVLPFLIFSLTSSKLPAYILPLLPPLAILAASTATTSAHTRWWRSLQIPLLLLTALFLVPGLRLAGISEFDWAPVCPTRELTIQFLLWSGPALILTVLILLARGTLQLILATAGIALATLAALDLIAQNENQLAAHTSAKKVCAALKPHLRPGDRVILFRNATRAVHLYLRHPLTISDRFEPELAADPARLADRYYRDDDPGTVYRLVDHEPRVFVITTDRKRGGQAGHDKSPLDFLRAGCRKPLHPIYRDAKYALLANFPIPTPPEL